MTELNNKEIEKEIEDKGEKASRELKALSTESEKYVDEILNVIKKMLKEKKSISCICITVSRSLTYLMQIFTKDIDTFKEEIDKAHNIVIDKYLPSLLNKESEYYDEDDTKIERILFSAPAIIEYIIWETLLGHIQLCDEKEE